MDSMRVLQFDEARGPRLLEAEPGGVQFRAHLPGMGREHEDAGAHDQRLFDGMGDEQKGEARVVPQRSSSACMVRRVRASSAATARP